PGLAPPARDARLVRPVERAGSAVRRAPPRPRLPLPDPRRHDGLHGDEGRTPLACARAVRLDRTGRALGTCRPRPPAGRGGRSAPAAGSARDGGEAGAEGVTAGAPGTVPGGRADWGARRAPASPGEPRRGGRRAHVRLPSARTWRRSSPILPWKSPARGPRSIPAFDARRHARGRRATMQKAAPPAQPAF